MLREHEALDESPTTYALVRTAAGAPMCASSVEQVAASLYGAPADVDSVVDLVVVVGGGPAGLAAAVYGSSEGLSIDPGVRSDRRAGGHQLDDPPTTSASRAGLGDAACAAPRGQAQHFGTRVFTGAAVHRLEPGTDGGVGTGEERLGWIPRSSGSTVGPRRRWPHTAGRLRRRRRPVGFDEARGLRLGGGRERRTPRPRTSRPDGAHVAAAGHQLPVRRGPNCGGRPPAAQLRGSTDGQQRHC